MANPLLRTAATSIIVLMLFSVLTPIAISIQSEDEKTSSDLADLTLVERVQARAQTANPMLLKGGTPNGAEFIESLEYSPGVYTFGGSWNTSNAQSLAFGSKTLSPTSPYGQEFYIGGVNNAGQYQFVSGANHNLPNTPGISVFGDLAVSIGGEVFVGGFFTGGIQFGSTIITSDSIDGFIAKADSSGQWIWAHSFQTVVNNSQESSQVNSITVDQSGDVIVAGVHEGETDFGGTTFNVSDQEVFVAKLDGQTGTLIWATSGGGIGGQIISGVAVDSSGDIFISGITFGTMIYGSSSYLLVGTSDTFLINFDSSGSVKTMSGLGTSGKDTQVTAMAISMNDDLYLGGLYDGTLQGSGPSGTWSITATQGQYDSYVLKNPFSTFSGTSWAATGGSSSTDSVRDIAINAMDEVFIVNVLDATFKGGTGSGAKYAYVAGNYDGMVAALSSSGTWDWVETTSSSGYELLYSVATNESGIVTVGGAIGGTMSKGSLSITSSGSTWDAMLWSLDPSTKKDGDLDGVPDYLDNCPTVSNSGQVDTDGDLDGDECDSDDDNDGLTDNYPDLCPRNSEINWISMQDSDNPSASTDWDNDGCKDDSEDSDDDNDQILDVNDLCPYTSYSPPRPTWVSNTATNDLDGDGCRDSDEDLNDDADSFDDSNDDCPTLAGTSTDGTTGCLDTDGDGWSDTTDDCPFEAGNSTLNGKNACPDDDGDGWSNADDSFPNEITQWSDLDSDGFGDNIQGVTPDECPTVPGSSTFDRLGCFDGDEDGYSNADSDWHIESGADTFPNDATQWSDFDEDGFGDNWANSSWNERKSSWPGEMVTDAATQDACPTRPGTSWKAGTLGCPDADGDGWYDAMDALMGDSTQWEDADMDGYGDNASGNEPDACPSISGNSTIDRFGCLDSDGDGYSNPEFSWGPEMGGDAFPDEPTQWKDTDGDGYGENSEGLTPDDCPTVRDSSNIDRYGCADTDGDGISDPDDVWTLADGADACVSGAGNSSADRIGCFDGDGDGYSNPTADWTLGDGADAYPKDPLLWLDDKSTEDGASSSTTMILGIGGIIALVLVAGLAVLFLRKPDAEDAETSWNDGSFAPMGGAMPTMAPNMYAQPAATPAVAMQNFSAQPVAQPAQMQPDPAREYCNGLIAQGYPHADAVEYTQHYYPGFQG